VRKKTTHPHSQMRQKQSKEVNNEQGPAGNSQNVKFICTNIHIIHIIHIIHTHRKREREREREREGELERFGDREIENDTTQQPTGGRGNTRSSVRSSMVGGVRSSADESRATWSCKEARKQADCGMEAGDICELWSVGVPTECRKCTGEGASPESRESHELSNRCCCCGAPLPAEVGATTPSCDSPLPVSEERLSDTPIHVATLSAKLSCESTLSAAL
jgi:hypothetical protein